MENLNAFEVMCLVYGRTLLKGGCSLSMWMNGSCLEHYMPDRGFVVGGSRTNGLSSTTMLSFQARLLASVPRSEEMVRDGKSVVLGTWVEHHPDAGERIVIDLCSLYDNVESFKIPLEIAHKRGERAIYDLETEREIFVNYSA